jgi:hypothetical protein
VLCDVISAVAEFMVSVLLHIDVKEGLQCLDGIYSATR